MQPMPTWKEIGSGLNGNYIGRSAFLVHTSASLLGTVLAGSFLSWGGDQDSIRIIGAITGAVVALGFKVMHFNDGR